MTVSPVPETVTCAVPTAGRTSPRYEPDAQDSLIRANPYSDSSMQGRTVIVATPV